MSCQSGYGKSCVCGTGQAAPAAAQRQALPPCLLSIAGVYLWTAELGRFLADYEPSISMQMKMQICLDETC